MYSVDHHKQLCSTIKEKAIHFSKDIKRIASPKGKTQNWLIDLRPILLDADCLEVICDLFWEKFESKLPFQIGGMEVAAVPLVTALLISAKKRKLNVSGFVIRKNRKRSGLGKRIEGTLTSEPIILVDDILNSGASMEKAQNALLQEGLIAHTVFTIINYESRKGRAWARAHNIDLHSLLSLKQIGLSLQSNSKPILGTHKILWRFVEPAKYGDGLLNTLFKAHRNTATILNHVNPA